MLVTAAVIGVVVFVSMLIPERPAPTEPVRPLHAEELPAQDPDVALAAMIGECQAGSIEACKRASRMTSDGQILAQIDHLLCFRGDQRSCESWLVRAQIICDDLTKCATLRELLRGQCLNGTTGEFCREAGWMAHLGYGGPVRPAYAKQVFEHDCNSTNENKAACEWRKLPPVSEQTCADGDAWACYGLGFEAYYWRRDVEASLAHVKRACEIGLEAGCRAVDLASEQIGPPLVFPD